MLARMSLFALAAAAVPLASAQLVGVSWAKGEAFGGNTIPRHCAALPNGNFAVLSTVQRSGRTDGVVSCYRPDGSAVWVKTIWASDVFEPAGVFGGSTGDVYVAGAAGPNGGRYAYASRIAATSGSTVWAKRYKLSAGARNDVIADAHLDGGNNLHLTGAARRLTGLAYNQPVYVRITANGSKGLTLFDSVPSTESSGVAIRSNASGRVAIASQTGSSSRAWLINSTVGTVFTKNVILMDDVTSVDLTGANEMYIGGRHFNTGIDSAPAVQKLNGSGTLQWTRWVNFPYGGNSLDTVSKLRVDGSGNVWAIGNAFNHDLDFAILKWSTAGSQLATRLLNSSATTSVDMATHLEFGTQSDIYVAGSMVNVANEGFMATRLNTNASFRWNRYLPVTGTLGYTFKNACFNPASGQYIIALHEAGLSRMVIYSLGQPGTPATDTYSISQNTTLNGSSVLANDIYAKDGIPVRVTGPNNGTLTLNADGTFIYKPTIGFTGVDSYTYKITKPNVADSTTTPVVIQVN